MPVGGDRGYQKFVGKGSKKSKRRSLAEYEFLSESVGVPQAQKEDQGREVQQQTNFQACRGEAPPRPYLEMATWCWQFLDTLLGTFGNLQFESGFEVLGIADFVG